MKKTNVSKILSKRLSMINVSKILLLISTVGIFSCVKDDRQTLNTDGNILLSYNMPYETSSDTKTPATPLENDIDEVAMIFFNKSDGVHVKHFVQDVSAQKNNTGSIAMTIPIDPVNGGLGAGDYDVLVLGNLKTENKNYLNSSTYQTTLDYIDAVISGITSPTLDKVAKELKVYSIDNSPICPLPLSGISELKFRTGENDIKMNVDFKRVTSSITVTNTVAAQVKFKLLWAKVCNYRSEAAIFEHKTNLGGIVVGDLTENTGVTPTEGTQVISGLYALPNMSSVTLQTNPNTTYLMIAGKYESSPTTTYYRINILGSGNIQRLSPNHEYKITINGVIAAGAASPAAASAAQSQTMSFDVTAWSDNSDFLSVETNSVKLYGAQDNYSIVEIFANDNNWDYEVTDNEVTDNDSNHFSVERMYEGLKITANNALASGSARRATITVSHAKDKTIPVQPIVVTQVSENPILKVGYGGVDSGVQTFAMEAMETKVVFDVDTGAAGLTWSSRIVETNYTAGSVLISELSCTPLNVNNSNSTSQIQINAPIFNDTSAEIQQRVVTLEIYVTETGQKQYINITQQPTPVKFIVVDQQSSYTLEGGFEELELSLQMVGGIRGYYTWRSEVFSEDGVVIAEQEGTTSSTTSLINLMVPLHVLGTGVTRVNRNLTATFFSSVEFNQEINVNIVQEPSYNNPTASPTIEINIPATETTREYWITVADRNVGASDDDEPGGWYNNRYPLVEGGDSKWKGIIKKVYPYTDYCKDFSYTVDGVTESGWRLPTYDELRAISNTNTLPNSSPTTRDNSRRKLQYETEAESGIQYGVVKLYDDRDLNNPSVALSKRRFVYFPISGWISYNTTYSRYDSMPNDSAYLASNLANGVWWRYIMRFYYADTQFNSNSYLTRLSGIHANSSTSVRCVRKDPPTLEPLKAPSKTIEIEIPGNVSATGDSYKLIVADRNVGTDEDGYLSGWWNNDGSKGDINWKGKHYEWSGIGAGYDAGNVDKAHLACFNWGPGEGFWRLPTAVELRVLSGGNIDDNTKRELQYETAVQSGWENGAWKLYDDRDAGLALSARRFVYFPVSGEAGGNASSLNYWSSGIADGKAMSLKATVSGDVGSTEDVSYSLSSMHAFSVRCVRAESIATEGVRVKVPARVTAHGTEEEYWITVADRNCDITDEGRATDNGPGGALPAAAGPRVPANGYYYMWSHDYGEGHPDDEHSSTEIELADPLRSFQACENFTDINNYGDGWYVPSRNEWNAMYPKIQYDTDGPYFKLYDALDNTKFVYLPMGGFRNSPGDLAQYSHGWSTAVIIGHWWTSTWVTNNYEINYNNPAVVQLVTGGSKGFNSWQPPQNANNVRCVRRIDPPQ